MSLPIVIVHVNDSIYLLHCLKQAKISNPNSPVYLISNEQTEHYRFIDHQNVTDYFESARQFASVYKKLHDDEPAGNLFAFQRWFILKDFMQKNNLSKCIHIDSDIMLYSDITAEQEQYSAFDLTLSKSQKAYKSLSAHLIYINNFEVIDDLCRFLTSLYTEPDKFKLLQDRAAEGNGYVSDMTGLYYYEQFTKYHIGFTTDIVNGTVFDHSMQSADGFKMKDGYKSIVWKDNVPYCQHLETKEDIKFHALHCQGKAKSLMKEMITPNSKRFNFSRVSRLAHYVKLGITKKLSSNWIKV
jgi:hypothetical protein